MTDGRPRIAILTSGYFPVIDGVTVSLHERLLRLSAWGCQTLVLVPDYQPAVGAYPDWQGHVGTVLPGVEVKALPSEPFAGLEWDRNPKRSARGLVDAWLGEFRPDIIVVIEPERQGLGYWARPGLRYARRAKTPIVAEYHTNFVDYLDDWRPFPRGLHRVCRGFVSLYVGFVFNSYDMTLAASDAAKARAARTGIGIRNVVSTAFVGLDTQRFRPQAKDRGVLRSRFGIDARDDQVVMTFLGRLTPDKGWRFLLDTLPQLAGRLAPEKVVPVIAGDGHMGAEITARLKPVFPRLQMVGRVMPESVPDLLAQSDLHVTASEKETLGLTVLEAQACGVPVLVPRVGSFLETVGDGVSGLLYENRNSEDFLRQLVTLLQDGDLRQRLGGAGPQNVRRRDWQVASRAWLDCLIGVLGK